MSVKTNMAVMHSVSELHLVMVIWHCLREVTIVDIPSVNDLLT